MKASTNLHLLLLMMILGPSQSQQTHCGSIRIEDSRNSSFLRRMILCKSDHLYFRTTIGLFPISSIDYSTKHVVVSHTPCSPSSSFLHPHRLSAGFPRPSGPNSLLLFNCSGRGSELPVLIPCDNGTRSGGACDSAPCLVVEDADVLEERFRPAAEEMKCTHYSRVYRGREGMEMGTRISFDVPDHVPNPCDECGKKAGGNCGAGLRCVCHPMKCKDKVVTGGAAVKPCGTIIIFLFILCLIII